MNETKNVSRRTRNPIFFRKDGGWKSVSTDCIVCMEACAYKCIFYIVSQGQVIDIMTYNSYGLQYYSFRKGKIGFARTVPVFLDNANSHQALQYNNITVSKNGFLRYSLTVDSF